jgi:hypothetical protein
MVDPQHLQQALDQVREVRRCVLQRQRFLGFSAGGRLAGAGLVLAAAVGLSRAPSLAPGDHVAVWLGVAAVAAAINYGLCLRWYQTLPAADRQRERLLPLVESFPPLALGGAATAGLILHGQYDLLPGIWMGLYGLVNFYAYPHLPMPIRKLGLFYLACGALFLLHPAAGLMRPWPVALVFVVGEFSGSLIIRRHTPGRAWWGAALPADGGES